MCRAGWAAWADEHKVIDRLGMEQVLQASDAYIQLNMRIDALDGTHISLPPIASPPGAVEGLAIAASEGGGTASVSWTSGALGANEHMAAWIAVVTSAGRSYYKNLMKLVDYSNAAQSSPRDIAASIVDRFGTLIEGQKLYLHAFVYDATTGLSSALAVANTIVAA